MVYQHDPEALDKLLAALGTARRRYALYYVREHGEADVADVTATVTDWLAARSGEAGGDARHRSRVRTSLHHADLPKLSEVGLVAVDHQATTVSFEGSRVGEALLDVLSEHERVQGQATVDGDSYYRGV